MTACTNHGGKARRVVTAALVGVLSVGTVPMVALAEGAEADGIQTLAANWTTDAKVTAAEDGKGSVYTGDLTKPVSFEKGSGKYLVPTEVTNQNGEVTSIDPNLFDITYSAKNDETSSFVGLNPSGSYQYVNSKGETVPVNGSAIDVEAAAAYFAGELTGLAGEPVTVTEDTYTVKVTEKSTGLSKSFDFSIKAASQLDGVYAYVGTDTSNKEIVFDGNVLLDDGENSGIKFANGDGSDLDVTAVTWKNADGTAANTSDATHAGTYIAAVQTTKGNVEVTVTVAKLDLSTASVYLADRDTAIATNGDLLNALEINGKTITNAGVPTAGTNGAGILKVVSRSDVNGYASKGEHTVVISGNDSDTFADGSTQNLWKNDVTGTATVTFTNYEDNIYSNESLTPADLDLDLYYGPQVATVVNVNLTEGQSFDASRISVREADGTPSYSGDAIEVSYEKVVDATTSPATTKKVDASALTEAGDYIVTVRVKPFQDSNGRWVGGTQDFTVSVNGNEAYGDNVSFYLNGKLSGTKGTLTFDGSDLLKSVTATVNNPEGGSFVAGTDFVLEAKVDGTNTVVDSIVDEGDYVITVKPLTFEWGSGVAASAYTFRLHVDPLTITSLKPYEYTGDAMEAHKDPKGNYIVSFYRNSAVAWTGSAVEVPAAQYWDADDEAWVELDESLYNVVRIEKANSDGSTKVVKEAVDPGNYTVTIALSDEAGSNYALKVRSFDFEVVKYAPFDDVESPAWYASAIADAKYTNIVHGIGGTDMFAPGAQITRAEAVCIVYNLAGGDNIDADYSFSVDGGYVTGFSDVDGHDYYARALAWAHNAGVVNGNGGKFDPDGKLTREQLAAMLANYAIATGDYEASDGSALAALPDAGTVSGWAESAVAWAVENGIMGNGGSVMAQNTITRSEVAAMAVNYASKF